MKKKKGRLLLRGTNKSIKRFDDMMMMDGLFMLRMVWCAEVKNNQPIINCSCIYQRQQHQHTILRGSTLHRPSPSSYHHHITTPCLLHYIFFFFLLLLLALLTTTTTNNDYCSIFFFFYTTTCIYPLLLLPMGLLMAMVMVVVNHHCWR